MGVFPSGQWGQTVNLLLSASVVRIHPRPPKKPQRMKVRWGFCITAKPDSLGGWIRTAAATSLKTAQKQPSATATSAASGRNREELLGQRPAGCECRPRHEADAGSRNPCSFLAARLANPQLSHNCLSQWGDDRVELFVLCLSLIGHAGVRTAPYTSLTTAPISLRMHSARGAISGGSWAGPGLMQT